MSQRLPSKDIVPNASLDPDVNSYAYESDCTIVHVHKAEFIKICENASVFPKGAYEVRIYTRDIKSVVYVDSNPPCPQNHRPEVVGSSDMGDFLGKQ